MRPKVSICLPNLNNLAYLPERFRTIFEQTFTDWELIVCDGYSDDGAWEYIQSIAVDEPRMRIFQTSRNGIYAGFNDCIERALGDYVYIATSDDTMAPDCLKKMAEMLDEHSDCGLCQCQLVVIDESGKPLPPRQQWSRYPLGRHDRDLVTKKNKRLAPHDGIMHPALFTIYTSVTQLLIRRSVFGRVGLFDGRWGAVSDFEWGMRVGLTENCIYIPDTLATWRRHAGQATQMGGQLGVRHKMIEMMTVALDRAASLDDRVRRIEKRDLIYFLERDIIEIGCKSARGPLNKIRFLLRHKDQYPRLVLDHLLRRVFLQRWSTQRHRRLRKILRKYSIERPAFY